MSKIDYEKFIHIWNVSSGPDEVAKLFNIPYWRATNLASRLRKKGYELNNFVLVRPSSYYAEIGAVGGKNGETGGFAAPNISKDGLTGRERASKAGRKGGLVRGKRRPR